jgi:L-lactate dehydrogenase (cytochrome)
VIAKDLTWSGFKAIRTMWDGQLVLKGVLSPKDAMAAVNYGADGIVVSNHGGRRLDGALSGIKALGPIVDAVNGRTTVMMDGGVRRIQDAAKALAMGAKPARSDEPTLMAWRRAARRGRKKPGEPAQ